MRGEILQYDDGVGTGLISGDDGVRYSFQRADLQQLRPLKGGMRVDFVADGAVARQIFVLDVQPQSGFGGPIETTNEDLSLWGYFAKCMAKSFSGEGRARRKEYWSFQLFLVIFLVGGFLVFAAIASASGYSNYMSGYDGYEYGSGPAEMIAGLLFLLMLVVFTPAGITVTIRRLHDIGLTGWFIFLWLIPYLGSLILFIMSLIGSERRVNKHGPYPKPLD